MSECGMATGGLPVRAWLVEALRSYGASLVVVSHDVEFVAGLQPDWVALV